MILPTPRAVGLAALGAGVALIAAAMTPELWILGPLGGAGVLALTVMDGLLAAPRGRAALTLDAPDTAFMGAADDVTLVLRFTGARVPHWVDAAPQTSENLTLSPAHVRARVRDGATQLRFTLTPQRRGAGMIEAFWLRWRGPLGLALRQTVARQDHAVAITPDIRSVRKEAIRLFSRTASFGEKIQLDRADGSEFEALRDFAPGMDRRAIDWKQSARHQALLAKEFRAERNHTIMLALDTGRLMSAQADGAPRIDRALNAALLLAYASLKLGDRVGLFGFDARPHLATGAVTGARSFPVLQRLSAQLDYSANETNFTLGLTQLAASLDRRALVVVFTDFADSTSAELMVENVSRLIARHRVLFVTFQDDALETTRRAAPETTDAVARAVIADTLLTERDVVLSRLKRLGVEVVEAPAARLGPALLNRYLALKRLERL